MGVIIERDRDREEVGSNRLGAMVVLIGGWFCCPVWCLGWYFACKSRGDTATKVMGIVSVFLASSVVIALAILIPLVVIEAHRAGSPSRDYAPAYYSPGYYYYYDYYYYARRMKEQNVAKAPIATTNGAADVQRLRGDKATAMKSGRT